MLWLLIVLLLLFWLLGWSVLSLGALVHLVLVVVLVLVIYELITGRRVDP